MVNPRRSNQNQENPFQTQTNYSNTIINLLKKPQAFPFLLSIFIFLTWVSLRFQHHPLFSPQNHIYSNNIKLNRLDIDNGMKGNLVKYLSSQLGGKDNRGWLLNPVIASSHAALSGGAVVCASVHVGEIRPGGMRGNHRHYTCNETFIIWGARVKFRLENNQVDKGYVEVIIGPDEVAVATSPSGTGHALVNIDHERTAFLLGCQDGNANHNGTSTTYNLWRDL